MSDLFYELKAKIKEKGTKIVFPESGDKRVYEAALRLAEENLVSPIFIGNEEDFQKECESITIINPKTYQDYDKMVEKFVERRKGKVTHDQAHEMLRSPNYFGTMLVYMGEASGLVSGATHSTADTVRPALQIIKTKPGLSKTFGYFIMLRDNEKYLMGDCAINPNPSSNDLAEFAVESAFIAPAYDIDPKVAMLSFSTNGSAVTDETTKVKEATALAKSMNPNLLIDGEMQFDAAFVESVGKSKFPGSDVAGKANVFIFPDLNSGNIGYKIAQRLGGFEAVGPFLAGLNSPVNDLSRGCNSEDVYKTAIVTAVQSIIK
ncbi:phosphate acetyltransferase [Mycoplasmatota bacterium]|nr:phosphate acetyltransferase [Mycoplasmatota bacterium]